MNLDETAKQRIQLWRGKTPEAEPEVAVPPFLVHGVNCLITAVVYDRKAAMAALPEGLEPTDPPTGLVTLYQVPSGWGLAPYSCCYVAIEVKGHSGPDGSSAYVMVAGWYSGRAGRIMHENYNTRFLPGETRHSFDGAVWRAEGGPVGRPYISVEMRQTGKDAPLTSGIHHFIGVNRETGLNIYSVSFSARYLDAESLRLDISPDAPVLLRSLEPLARPFGFYLPDMPLTFSRPRRLTDSTDLIAAEAVRVMMLDIFGRLGRPAAILGRGGRVIHLNQEAEMLSGDGFITPGRHLRATRAASQPALESTIERAFGGDRAVEPMALPREGSVSPLLVHAMPMDPTAAGEQAVLVLFTDPARRGGGPTAGTLQLLGLTPAEARVAALVGAGHSPKEAAEWLNISEGTARSTLKLVYSKLDIRRQAELAQLVARLEGV